MEFGFFSYFQRTLSRPSSEKALSCWNVNDDSEQQSPVLLNSDNSVIACSSLSPSVSSFPSHALLLSPSISLPLTLAVSLFLSARPWRVLQLRLGADQKRGSLQWNKSLHNSCGKMALIADWFEAEAADICNAEPHLPHSPHHSPLWLSIVQAVYFVVMSGKWQVKEAKGARHQIGSLSKRRSVKLDIINTPLRPILQTSWRWQRCKLAVKIHTLYTKTVIKPPLVYRGYSLSWLRANQPLKNSF